MRPNDFLLLLVALWLGLFPEWMFAQLTTLDGSPLQTTEIETFLEKKMAEYQLPGISLAIIQKGEVAFHLTKGVKHLGTMEPISDETLFEGASITKPVFAYLVMQLVAEGKLDLDRPLHLYKPNEDLAYDPRHKAITARMVLTHQTGMPNWRYENKGMEIDLKFDPGTQFSYSGEAYVYLSRVVEHICQQSINQLLTERVFEPLGMTNTYVVLPKGLENLHAHGHFEGTPAGGIWLPKRANVASSIRSEAADFSRFVIELSEGKYLKQPHLSQFLSPQVEIPQDHVFFHTLEIHDFSLGLGMERGPSGETIFAHGGNNVDFQSYFQIEPQQGFGFVFFANSNKAYNYPNRPFAMDFAQELTRFLHTGEYTVNHLQEEFEWVNRRMYLYEKNGISGYGLDVAPGDGIAWLKAETFETGIIEFDLMGSNQQDQSFVGLAFQGADDQTYEAVYFRPFAFGNEGPDQEKLIQYVSLPSHSWEDLRELHPGKYESGIAQVPQPEDWFHVKLVLRKDLIQVYTNHAERPDLEVARMVQSEGKKIGFWVGNNSSGRFANLQLTPDQSATR